MPIRLDSATAIEPGGGVGKVFEVRCDGSAECGRRTYLFAANSKAAGRRAEAEYGWRFDGKQIWCAVHRREGVTG